MFSLALRLPKLPLPVSGSSRRHKGVGGWGFADHTVTCGPSPAVKLNVISPTVKLARVTWIEMAGRSELDNGGSSLRSRGRV